MEYHVGDFLVKVMIQFDAEVGVQDTQQVVYLGVVSGPHVKYSLSLCVCPC